MKKKKSLREEIEYRLGLYFSLKSGALYVRDEKYGTQESIMKQLESDVTQDIKFLARTLNSSPGRNITSPLDPDMSFRDIVLFYKKHLMKN